MRYVKLAIGIGLYLRPSVVHANCTSDRMLLALLWQEKELAGARARRRYATTELLQWLISTRRLADATYVKPTPPIQTI